MTNKSKISHTNLNWPILKILNEHYIYLSLFFFSALIVAGVIISDVKPQHYKLLALLPLTFSIGSLLAFNAYKNYLKKLSITIILTTYFIRLVILPFLMYKARYAPVFSYNIYFPEIVNYGNLFRHMNTAILLVCYESITVFLWLAISKFEVGGFFDVSNKKLNLFGNRTSKLFNQVVFLMLLYISIVLVLYPQMGNYVQFFIATSVEKDVQNFLAAREMKATVPSLIYWSYILIFDILQVLIPVILIGWFYRFFANRLRRIGLFLSFIVIALVFAFMTPLKVTSIQIGIVLLIMLSMMYPDIMQKRAPLMLVAIFILTIVGLMLKSGSYKSQGQQGYEFLAYIVNVYFAGPLSVAAGISMPETVTFRIALADFLRSIPIVQYFFKDMVRTPDIYNQSILQNAPPMLIIPMVAQTKFYIGSLLSPLFTLISVQIAVYFERTSEKSSMLLKKYILLYATFITSMVPAMYNLNIMFSSLFMIFICLIMMRLAESKLMSNGVILIEN